MLVDSSTELDNSDVVASVDSEALASTVLVDESSEVGSSLLAEAETSVLLVSESSEELVEGGSSELVVSSRIVVADVSVESS